MSSLRLERVSGLIQEELGKLLLTETRLKIGVFVTIVKVRVTPDLRNARISISVFPEGETNYVMSSLANTLYKLQKLLNQRLHMRPLPRLLFENDTTEQGAQAVEEALIAIRKEGEGVQL
jgi:ribosome-binding factor A